MCGAILHMWTKIGDDQSKTSTSTPEILTLGTVALSFKHEYIRLTLGGHTDAMAQLDQCQKYFFLGNFR